MTYRDAADGSIVECPPIACPVCCVKLIPHTVTVDRFENMLTVYSRCHEKAMQCFVYPESGRVLGYYENDAGERSV